MMLMIFYEIYNIKINMNIARITLFAILFIFVYLYLSIPFYNGLYYSSTTKDDIKIYREDNGIPHI